MIKTNSKKDILTKTLTFLVLFFLFSISFAGQSFSYSISPAIEEFFLEIYQKQESSIYFTNTTTGVQNFKVYSHRYNPEKEKIIDERDFVTLEQEEISLEPNQTSEIKYKINIPEDTLAGSYFSIIVVEGIEEQTPTPTSAIALNYGIGSLIAVHVIDETDIAEVFLTQTQVTLKHKQPLNPFNTEIEYRIKNNSKYTFLPTGQLIIASEGDAPLFYTLNSEEQKLYPNTEISFSFNYKGNYEDFLKDKKVIARVGTQFSNQLRETQIDLLYFNQTLTAGFFAGSILVAITIAVLITKKKGDKKATEMLKKKMSPENS